MGKLVIKVLLIICSLHLDLIAFAQESNPMFYKEIQLKNKSYSLESLTKEVQQQTGITFSYNATKINGQKHIAIKKNRITLEQLLPIIKKHSGIDYKMINQKHIIYTVAKDKESRRKVVRMGIRKKETTVVHNMQKEKDHSIKEEVVLGKLKSEDIQAQISVIGDSAVAAPYYVSGGGGGYSGGADLVVMTRK